MVCMTEELHRPLCRPLVGLKGALRLPPNSFFPDVRGTFVHVFQSSDMYENESNTDGYH